MAGVSSFIFLLQAIAVFGYSFYGDIPDPKDTALMSRYIVHNSDWTAVSYISSQPATKGLPLAALFSVSDGPVEGGTGIPYFYVSRLQQAVTDLMDGNNNCSLIMSLAQSDICKNKNWDPEDPRCAQVILAGTFHKINNDSAEYEKAKNSVFTRHPSFKNLPESHHFFLAKLNINHIIVQDSFGGPSVVSVDDYFKVQSRSPEDYHSGGNRNKLLLLTPFIIFVSLLS